MNNINNDMQLEPTQQCVFAWGKNDGKLILKNSKKTKLTVPQKIKIQFPVERVCCTDVATFLLSKQGDVYQLKNTNLRKIPELKNIIKIASGQNHILALDVQNRVYSWGEGKNGCLANGSFKNCEIPIQILHDQKVIDIYCGSYSSFFILHNEEIYASGSNRYGQLAHSSFKCLFAPIRIETRNIKVIQIAGGVEHTLFLSIEGDVYAVGNGKQGRLGILNQKDINHKLQKVNTKEKFKSIYAGNYSAAINQKGQLFIWGKSLFGNFSEPTVFLKINKNFNAMALYQDNGYALTSEGEVWVWGNNLCGELGVGDSQIRFKPFPLILLENRIIEKIFAGPNCAFCISHFERKKKNRVIERISLKSIKKNGTSNNSNHQKSLNSSIKKSKDAKTNRSKIQSAYKFPQQKIKPQNLRRNKFKENNTNKVKSLLIPPENRYLTINQNDYQQSNNNRFDETININQYKVSTLNNQKKDSSLIVEPSEIQLLQKQLEYAKEENNRLSLIIQEKDFLLEDVTSKIRILEQAIAKKESLYPTVNQQFLFEEMKKNERRYLNEIQKLNTSIQNLINSKEKGQYNRSETQEARIIKELQLKNHQYLSLIKERDLKLQEQENLIKIMKEQIQALENEIFTMKKVTNSVQQKNNNIELSVKQKDDKILQDSKRVMQMKEKIIVLEKEIHKLHLQKFEKNRLKTQEFDILNSKIDSLEIGLKQRDQQIFELKELIIQKNTQIQKIYEDSRIQEESLISIINNRNLINFEDSRQVLSNITNKENQKVVYGTKSKKSEKSDGIERTILKIEQNRKKISTSANKLIHILDMST